MVPFAVASDEGFCFTSASWKAEQTELFDYQSLESNNLWHIYVSLSSRTSVSYISQ